MLHFLEPVLTVFAAIAVITLAAVVCIGCIALAFKVGDSFKGKLKERYAGCRNKWKRRVCNLADFLGEKVGVTLSVNLDKILNQSTTAAIDSDSRSKMIGKWVSENDDEMIISEEGGLYKMAVKEKKSKYKGNYLIGLAVIPINRQTLFLADGATPMVFGFSVDQEFIYIPDTDMTFHRTRILPSEFQAELDKTFENSEIREEPVFEDTPAVSLSSDTRARILKIINDDNSSSIGAFDEIEEAVNRNIIE
ncbi:MAG: hypothetical protein NC453_23190 [Muribaculum sp.]|nr:hypothetical protein [Muribaculum sp.]